MESKAWQAWKINKNNRIALVTEYQERKQILSDNLLLFQFNATLIFPPRLHYKLFSFVNIFSCCFTICESCFWRTYVGVRIIQNGISSYILKMRLHNLYLYWLAATYPSSCAGWTEQTDVSSCISSCIDRCILCPLSTCFR